MSTVIGAWPTAACQAARQPCEPSTSYIPLQSRNPCPHTRPAPRARLTSRPATAAFMDAQVASSGSGLVTGLWTLVIGAAALYFGRELLQQVPEAVTKPPAQLCPQILPCAQQGGAMAILSDGIPIHW